MKRFQILIRVEIVENTFDETKKGSIQTSRAAWFLTDRVHWSIKRSGPIGFETSTAIANKHPFSLVFHSHTAVDKERERKYKSWYKQR